MWDFEDGEEVLSDWMEDLTGTLELFAFAPALNLDPIGTARFHQTRRPASQNKHHLNHRLRRVLS
jgi:hypothetical protein